MNALSAYCLVIVATLCIDIVARWALSRPKNEHEMKPAGLLPLLLLCFLQGRRTHNARPKVIKQFFLALTIVVFLAGSNWILITLGAPKDADVLGFALLVTPLLTMPFFHIIYGLIGIQPLCVNDLLEEFRMRGAIAIILSANTIFIALEPMQPVIGLLVHLSMALLALLGTFYLCAHQRKRAAVYHAPFQNIEYGLEPMLLNYVAATLEVLYSIVVIVEIFMRNALEEWLAHPFDDVGFALTILAMLLCSALFTKIRFLFGPVLSLEFYEQRALPLSFLFFGTASILRYYL